MSTHVRISDQEYGQRIQRAAMLAAKAGLDVFIANSNEADYANCRYFSGYWPLFEIGGVAIAPSGKSALMIGPESGEYARDRSKIPNIHKMVEYRESADPAYPGVKVSNFQDVCTSIGVSNAQRIGVAGYLVTTMPVIEGIRAAFPNAQIINADNIMTSLRQIKSPAELDCLREGFRISEIALDEVLKRIKPGLTELQVVGIAQQAYYENGAEYEAHPVYALSGISTTHAISRPTHRVLQKGDMVQLNLGARVDGYSPSVGRPICLGKMTPRQKDLVKFGLDAHYKTYEWIKAGVIAADVAKKFIELVKQRGFESTYLYGPCHGLGMIEVEKPWMETISNYPLEANMTFQADTFFHDPDFGLRWENGLQVTPNGSEMMSKAKMEILEL
ncbi:MAG: Xaa-Pro peptidase family protein [Phycisphaerae bacterium]